jgi:GNAT superfamily N-acetyltransferase
MIVFKQTREIKEYRVIIDSFIPDFGHAFLHTILQWCRLAYDPFDKTNQFWELWTINYRFSIIGICGLYSLNPKSTDELWLGWLGLIPKWRNKNNGPLVMKFLYDKAKEKGCKKIMCYVDKEGRALNFYKREGFEVIGTVRDYLYKNNLTQIDGFLFESPDDYVIQKYLFT